MRKWRKNGVTPKRRIAEILDKSRLFKEMQINMKLGIVESEPVSETLHKRTNADKA